jgi:hypothetical protein
MTLKNTITVVLALNMKLLYIKNYAWSIKFKLQLKDMEICEVILIECEMSLH